MTRDSVTKYRDTYLAMTESEKAMERLAGKCEFCGEKTADNPDGFGHDEWCSSFYRAALSRLKGSYENSGSMSVRTSQLYEIISSLEEKYK